MPSGKFPSTLPDWSNLSVLHRNTLPPRSTFFNYSNTEDALSYDRSKAQLLCLNGTWKFSWSKSPFEAASAFWAQDYDCSNWNDITVPSMWQLEGYGKPHYANIVYPFPVDPPNVPYDDNQTGSYLVKFEVPASFSKSEIRLRFEGVDSAFHVWVNGTEVGYSQGARNASEFDITDFISTSGKNTLAIRVYQWSDGSYIEDQDQWWLSGIFRDVFLLAFPKDHIQDYQVQTLLDESYTDAILSVKVQVKGEITVTLRLLDAANNLVTEKTITTSSTANSLNFSLPIKSPQKWTAEDPYLYHLTLQTNDQIIAQRIGFRQVELKNGLITVNGKRIVFRGVNRHEHHPSRGRAVGLELLKQDLLLMKSHNINAIRTSHQPNDYRFYDLADELGFWVMDEADLECHGFDSIHEASLSNEEKTKSFAEKKAITYGRAGYWTSDNPEWKEAYLDRARHLMHRDKNHASVIMWSLGNEAFYGSNFAAMYQLIKEFDPTRLIHYEGDVEALTTDCFSLMYPKIEDIVSFAENWNGKKPMILCEFAHAMGNGPGSFKEYLDEFYSKPCLQGGFVWEWANHGLLTQTEEGEDYYGYGGDFGDEPNDYNFVLDGLVSSNHKPLPGLLEYKKAIEPVQLVGSNEKSIEIISRYDFISLDHLKATFSIVGDGLNIDGSEILIPPTSAGRTAFLEVPDLSTYDINGESYLQITFALKKSTLWAETGHEIAFLQIPIKLVVPITKEEANPTSTTIQVKSGTILEINGSHSHWKFDCVRGQVSSWQKHGVELIKEGPILDFDRAPTDNDCRIDSIWTSKYLHSLKPHTRSVTWDESDGKVIIICNQRIAPPVLEWSIDAKTTYTFSNNQLLISASGNPQGQNLPPIFPRIGLTLSLTPDIKATTWFGRGPGESYKDKKLSQKFGTYTLSIDDLSTDYEFPQENGNRTDVRWVEFLNSRNKEASLKAVFLDKPDGFNFAASHYRTKDVAAAQHPYELRKKKLEEVVVRLDMDHQGLGSASCGPLPLSKYELKSEPFKFSVLLG